MVLAAGMVAASCPAHPSMAGSLPIPALVAATDSQRLSKSCSCCLFAQLSTQLARKPRIQQLNLKWYRDKSRSFSYSRYLFVTGEWLSTPFAELGHLYWIAIFSLQTICFYCTQGPIHKSSCHSHVPKTADLYWLELVFIDLNSVDLNLVWKARYWRRPVYELL